MTQTKTALCALFVSFCFCSEVDQVSPPWGFVFKDWSGEPVDVIVYIPSGAHKNTEILMVVPGASRDTQRFHASWLSLAKEDTFVVVTIGASKKHFPDEYSYNAGNVLDEVGNLVGDDKWLFNAIEKIFNRVKENHGFKTEKFHLFGHSAGGGFVHRYMLFMPQAPVVKAVAANPAFVTLPDRRVGYPFGLKNIPINDRMIGQWLEKKMAIVLGADDTGPRSKPLSNGPQAKRQGPSCLSRGKRLFREAKKEAKKREVNFGWSLNIVPRVGHDNRLIAPHARKFLFN
mgnify:FL=1|tara:strand:- start:664 stop:1524 length:861 start_codon:yes stop_codon:yes gene_type:complete